MATPSKYRKSESKSVDFNRRAEELQCEIERLEITLGPSVALYPQIMLILGLTQGRRSRVDCK